jgi:serpin B
VNEMKKKKIFGMTLTCIVAVVVIFALFYSGFFSSPKNVQAIAVDTYATSESVASLSDSMNDFSLDMYQQISVGADDNVFFSPYSIFVALAMTYEGARGDTAEQMKNVLGFEQNDEISLCSFGRIYNLLNIDAEYTLNTANALWTKKDYPFLDEYLDFIDNYYMGKATDVDFTNPQAAADIINKWIEENTGGKIEEMLSSGDISPGTVLILSNAIYFKGSWLTKFNAHDTVDIYFELTDKELVQVPTMVLKDSKVLFNYTETEDLQILELPYTGNDVAMLILLPKENDIINFNQKITSENLENWMDSMYPTLVDIYLPKFKFKTEYNLKNMLIDMGLDIAFSSYADFSGMNGYGGLFIEKVLHKAFIEVKEEGTEAAAATTVHILETAMPEPIKVFNVNHSFTFLIQHKETGTILFMGSVINPLN